MLLPKPLLLLTITILFCTATGYSQYGWLDPDSRDFDLRAERKFSDETIEQLKKTQTVFFYPGSIRPQLDSLKRVVSESWDLTKVIFDEASNISNYMDPKYSIFSIEAIDDGAGSHVSIHYLLALRLITEVSKKGKPKKPIALCRIDLFPNEKSLMKKAKGFGKELKKMDEIYEDGIFLNFSPVLIKAQLQRASDNIKNKIRPKMTEFIKTDNFSQLLANDTLYIPVSVLEAYDPLTWNDKTNNDNLFKNYPHKYRFCTDAELYQIFETEQRGRLLFEFVCSSYEKIVTIYDLKDKKPVYRQQSFMRYHLNETDIERLLE